MSAPLSITVPNIYQTNLLRDLATEFVNSSVGAIQGSEIVRKVEVIVDRSLYYKKEERNGFYYNNCVERTLTTDLKWNKPAAYEVYARVLEKSKEVLVSLVDSLESAPVDQIRTRTEAGLQNLKTAIETVLVQADILFEDIDGEAYSYAFSSVEEVIPSVKQALLTYSKYSEEERRQWEGYEANHALFVADPKSKVTEDILGELVEVWELLPQEIEEDIQHGHLAYVKAKVTLCFHSVDKATKEEKPVRSCETEFAIYDEEVCET